MNFPPMSAGREIALLVISALLFNVSALDMPPEDCLADAYRRFHPEKPAVCMRYSVAYRLLGLELKRLAEAEVIAVEGTWTPAAGGAVRPACLVNFNLDTGTGENKKRGMVQIHNRITSVLTMPDLNAVIYIKRSQQRISILGRRKFINNLEVYNVESGSLDYVCHDYMFDKVSTNLVGAEDLVRQGREVSRFLKILYANYNDEDALDKFDSEQPVYIYTEGDLVPFKLSFQNERDVVPVLGLMVPSLYFAASPHANAAGRGRNFKMWAASFRDVSLLTGHADLIGLSKQTLPWSMIPLQTDLGMPLGSIRCFITDIRAKPLSIVKSSGTSVLGGY